MRSWYEITEKLSRLTVTGSESAETETVWRAAAPEVAATDANGTASPMKALAGTEVPTRRAPANSSANRERNFEGAPVPGRSVLGLVLGLGAAIRSRRGAGARLLGADATADRRVGRACAASAALRSGSAGCGSRSATYSGNSSAAPEVGRRAAGSAASGRFAAHGMTPARSRASRRVRGAAEGVTDCGYDVDMGVACPTSPRNSRPSPSSE